MPIGVYFLELLAEFEVVLPDAAIRGVDDARAVIETALDQLLRHEFVQLERRQRGHERRQIIVRRSFAANRADRQDEVADLGRVLEAAALAQETARLPDDRR